MCAMLLADLGAEVIRVDRLEPADLGLDRGREFNVLNRGRRSVAVDLKSSDGIETVLRLIDQADALIEGFRPGVTERLGLGPEVCFARNPKLVYGRMTGWGQEGPMAHAAGHDINYIALTGALSAIGTTGGPPVPPLNLVGDFGGGALYLAFGVCAALLEAQRSGEGQVVDAAMVDGAASLMAAIYGLYAAGSWTLDRGDNLLDTGAHFYGTYECADGEWVSIGSIEKRFHDILLDKLGLTEDDIPDRMDRTRWVEHKKNLTALFLSKTRARVVRDHGRFGYLLRPGAVAGRGPQPPAHGRSQHLHRTRRCAPACAGTEVQPHTGRGPLPGTSSWPTHRGDPAGMGLDRG